ncbi:MAG TPA: glycosyltransferase, partial [Aliiroseovarius sp.]|nr:glycosyltransferase [Aliiroseovarius sp.]
MTISASDCMHPPFSVSPATDGPLASPTTRAPVLKIPVLKIPVLRIPALRIAFSPYRILPPKLSACVAAFAGSTLLRPCPPVQGKCRRPPLPATWGQTPCSARAFPASGARSQNSLRGAYHTRHPPMATKQDFPVSMSHRVFVVLAVHAPDPEYLRLQLESLARQTHRDLQLICVEADTRSGALVRELADAAGLEADLVCPGHPLDAVSAFEAGLQAALGKARDLRDPDADADADADEPLIALCDQDDVWHPDRLERSIAAWRQSGADLVHSDARLIDADGQELHPSMFAYERRLSDPGLRGLLYRNNITGMTCLFPARLAEIALPFPAQSGVHFYHDLWLGLLAAAMGGVHLIREPLVDYRQHANNAIGAVERDRTSRRAARRRGLPDRLWFRSKAANFGLARFLAHEVHYRMSEVTAAGLVEHQAVEVTPLRPFLARWRGSGALLRDAGWLALRGHGQLARIALGHALVQVGRVGWVVQRTLRTGLPEQAAAFDERLYSLAPGVAPHPLGAAPPSRQTTDYTARTDSRKTPKWTPDFTAERPALCVLVPTLNPTEVFAGITTALDFGLGVAAQGLPVRFIATDLPIAAREASLHLLHSRLPADALARARGNFSLHCSVQEPTIPAHRQDRFLATAWWSAHVAARQIAAHDFQDRRFFYLLQDYEPNFYPWGNEYADARASYDLDFDPIFNTRFLRGHFADQGFAFATDTAPAFHPAIELERYTGPRPQPAGRVRRLALYGRPEVERNMFPAALEALALFVQQNGLTPAEIELVSVGLPHEDIRLPDGHLLHSLGKLPLSAYPGFLRET